MGQKINPNGFHIGVIRDRTAKWYADKDFVDHLNEDLRIRKYIEKRSTDVSVSIAEIERTANRVNVSIHTAKPGTAIGKGGPEVEAPRKEPNKLTGKRIHINTVEIKEPDLDAHLVGESAARQLEARIAFRCAMHGVMQRAMRAEAKGIKTQVVGRLNGANMSRIESYSDGTAPLHALRADIDYSWDGANITYGVPGVKTWVCHGEAFPTKKSSNNDEQGGE